MATAVAIVLLFALFLAAAGAHAEPADEFPCALPACKTVGGGSQFFDVQFCLAALGSDRRSGSHCMDYQAYSVVAADLLAANVTAAAAKIDGLLRGAVAGRRGGGGDEATARCLRSCQALYGGTVRRQPGCTAAVRGVRKGEATTCLEGAAAAAKQCEHGFQRSKAASPVTGENRNVFMLAKLAVALLGEVYANK